VIRNYERDSLVNAIESLERLVKEFEIEIERNQKVIDSQIERRKIQRLIWDQGPIKRTDDV
jgi:uncharacterized FAD-dependent dehydrogenase